MGLCEVGLFLAFSLCLDGVDGVEFGGDGVDAGEEALPEVREVVVVAGEAVGGEV